MKIGDKVRLKLEPVYTGTITRMEWVNPKGFSEGYYWLYLDDSEVPTGFDSTKWEVVEPK